MSIFEALILGLVQGLTEFIPVSSSGHLILTHELFGSAENSLAFDVALHVGTLGALLLVFYKDVLVLAKNVLSNNKQGRLARLLLLATLPAAFAGLLFGDLIDEHARIPLVVAGTLAVVGILMLISERYASSSVPEDKTPSTKQGLTIGFAQALALVPGVSRSGATMTAGFFMGMGRKQAVRFSFLLSIPIIAGSALGILLKDSGGVSFNLPLLVGMVTALLSGFFAIKFMLNIIEKVGLKPFAYYRIILAFFTIVLTLVL